MGLLSKAAKFGKGVGRRFDDQYGQMIRDPKTGSLYEPSEWTKDDYLAAPGIHGLMFGVPGGAALGAANAPDDPGRGAMAGMGMGVGAVAGLSAGIGGGIAAKRMIIALAKQIMQSDPRVSAHDAVLRAVKIQGSYNPDTKRFLREVLGQSKTPLDND